MIAPRTRTPPLGAFAIEANYFADVFSLNQQHQ